MLSVRCLALVLVTGQRLHRRVHTCMSCMTAGMPSFSCCTRGLVSAERSVGRNSVRSPVRSAVKCPLAVMRVCSSPSSRRCLPLVLLLPNQLENLSAGQQSEMPGPGRLQGRIETSSLAVLRVCSSPSSRRCLPLMLLLPNQLVRTCQQVNRVRCQV